MKVQKEKRIPIEDIEKIEVPDMETAEKVSFQGSPTILINGIDIYTETKPQGVHYSCRVFQFDLELTGVIPFDFIRKKYNKLKTEEEDY